MAGRGWTAARDLAAGDQLNEADDSDDATVVSSVREEHPEGVAVYNFEVEGDHTYFVEDGLGLQTAVWVHNTCDYTDELALSKKSARTKLDRRLGGVSGDELDAHHIIPLDLIDDPRTREIIVKTARGGFDINAARNGILLSELLHTGPHNKYINAIANKVSKISQELDDVATAGAVWAIADKLKKALPGLHRPMV